LLKEISGALQLIAVLLLAAAGLFECLLHLPRVAALHGLLELLQGLLKLRGLHPLGPLLKRLEFLGGLAAGEAIPLHLAVELLHLLRQSPGPRLHRRLALLQRLELASVLPVDLSRAAQVLAQLLELLPHRVGLLAELAQLVGGLGLGGVEAAVPLGLGGATEALGLGAPGLGAVYGVVVPHLNVVLDRLARGRIEPAVLREKPLVGEAVVGVGGGGEGEREGGEGRRVGGGGAIVEPGLPEAVVVAQPDAEGLHEVGREIGGGGRGLEGGGGTSVGLRRDLVADGGSVGGAVLAPKAEAVRPVAANAK